MVLWCVGLTNGLQRKKRVCAIMRQTIRDHAPYPNVEIYSAQSQNRFSLYDTKT